MSLTKKASKTTLRAASEDMASCLDQKNGIISVLQSEVDELRSNQEKYDRIKEDLYRTRNNY